MTNLKWIYLTVGSRPVGVIGFIGYSGSGRSVHHVTALELRDHVKARYRGNLAGFIQKLLDIKNGSDSVVHSTNDLGLVISSNDYWVEDGSEDRYMDECSLVRNPI
jgi:ABC-type dipeptide/oligopeptide/nickel transport system ATPase component